MCGLPFRRMGKLCRAGSPRKVRFLRVRIALQDVLLLVGAIAVAALLRYDFQVPTLSWPRTCILLGTGSVSVVVLGGALGLYTGRWLRGGFEERAG